MNLFQKEVVRREKAALKLVGLGSLTKRRFTTLVRKKLKVDLKVGKKRFNSKKGTKIV